MQKIICLRRAVCGGILSMLCFAALPTFACVDESTTPVTKAQSGDVVLSELLPAPSDGEEEFIELHNVRATAVDVSGWTIEDAVGHVFYMNTDVINPVMDADAYLVISEKVSNIGLNNDGDHILLRDDAGNIMDETTYERADEGQSWSRFENQWQWSSIVTMDAQNHADELLENETPTQKDNSSNDKQNIQTSDDTSSNAMTSKAIVLNELFPNPTGDEHTDEWIELSNIGDESVNLDGWRLMDATTTFTFSNMMIGGHEYVVLESGDSNIALNNTGDSIFLIDPFGTVLQGVEYGNAEENTSFAWNGVAWQWTTHRTPDDDNIFDVVNIEADTENATPTSDSSSSQESSLETLSIESFRQQEDGFEAVIKGSVSVLPGVLGSQYFYIQDSTSGMQVYSYSKSFPDLVIGDVVQVTGIKSTARGEVRIKTDNAHTIEIQDHGEDVVIVDVDTLSNDVIGMLVRVYGTVTEKSSSSFVLDDGIAVSIKSGTGIDMRSIAEGAMLEVVGIVIQSDDELRLAPRDDGDILEKEEDSLFIASAHATSRPIITSPQSPQHSWIPIIVAGFGGIILSIIIFVLWQKAFRQRILRETSMFTRGMTKSDDSTLFGLEFPRRLTSDTKNSDVPPRL